VLDAPSLPVADVADLNGDGLDDLVVMKASVPATHAEVRLSLGGAQFAEPILVEVGQALESMVIADLNADGIPDLAGVDVAGLNLYVLLGDGTGGFTLDTIVPLGTGADPRFTPETRAIEAADFNADGRMDLVLAASLDGTIVLLNETICPADITGDGSVDADDFFAYLDLFASGDNRADLTGDGTIDSQDFFALLDLFIETCA